MKRISVVTPRHQTIKGNIFSIYFLVKIFFLIATFPNKNIFTTIILFNKSNIWFFIKNNSHFVNFTRNVLYVLNISCKKKTQICKELLLPRIIYTLLSYIFKHNIVRYYIQCMFLMVGTINNVNCN